MQAINNNTLVRFHPEIDTPLGLIIPERYTVYNQTMETDNESRMGVTTDRRLINPQVVDILSGEHEGEVGFVYYGAYEVAKLIQDDTYVIPENNLLFLCNPIRPMPGIFLCERIWNEGEKSESGLFVSPNAGSYDALRMKVLFVPEQSTLSVGQTIITTSPAQYELRYEGQKYIMVREKFIAGYDEDTPYGDNILVEYLPDEGQAERDAHNEKIRTQLDFMKYHGMHYAEQDFKMEKEPKIIQAIILKGTQQGEKCLIYRDTGVALRKDKWVCPLETLIGVVR